MKELKEIREQLIQMAETEAVGLWRSARNAQKRGCSPETVNKIQEEADWLHTTGTAYPDRLIDWKFGYEFKYAFR